MRNFLYSKQKSLDKNFLHPKRKKNSGKKFLHPKQRENHMKKILKKKNPHLPGRRAAAPLPCGHEASRRGAPPRRAAPMWARSSPPHRSLRPRSRIWRKKKEKRSKASWEKQLLSRDPVLVRGGDFPPAKQSSNSVIRCAVRAQALVDPDRAARRPSSQTNGRGKGEEREGDGEQRERARAYGRGKR